MAVLLIVVHGGAWDNDIYNGGMKDYILVPRGGIGYNDFLTKLEVRLKKDKSMHIFDIDAMITSECGDTIRMKVTDEFEWSFLMEMRELPIIYVNACPKTTCTPNQITNDEIIVNACTTIVTPNTSVEIRTSINNCASTQWIIAGASQHACVEHDEIPLQMEPIDAGQLLRGSVFSSEYSLISAIHEYHLKNHLEFRTPISNLKKLHVSCKDVLTCPFSLRAKSYGNAWRIYEWVTHTCEKDLRTGAGPKISSRAIAEYIGPNITEDGYVVRAKDIQGQFLRDFRVRLNYATALVGKNRALKMIYGDHDKSFQMVAKYLYMLEHMNLGSVVALQTLDDCTFQYCFFSLGTSIQAFRACCPFIVIDATHLRGKYRGVLFVATTKDANEQIVPLTFGVGDKENDLSWTWFLEHVRKSLGSRENLLIVSDQHKSIKNVVQLVFPSPEFLSIFSFHIFGTPHGFCTYHIQGNLRNFKDLTIDLFHAAASTYREEDFLDHMNNIKKSAPGAYAKLMDIGPMRWASCKCPVRRYAFGTSNAVESLNGRLKWAQKLPVASLLEYARNMIKAWFYKRRTEAGSRDNDLSETAEKRLGFAIAKGSSYRVEPISNLKFNIISGTKSNIVDLCNRVCSCKVFQMDLFPCSHAIAAIRYKKQTPLAYVHSYYSTRTWHQIYTSEVMSVPDPSYWHVPLDIEARVVGTPKNPRQAGRPKEKRIPSIPPLPQKEGPSKEGPTNEDPKKVRACSRCHMKGHYATTCEAFIQDTQKEVVESTEVGVKRRRKPKKCTICGVAGHTRKTCTDPNRFA